MHWEKKANGREVTSTPGLQTGWTKRAPVYLEFFGSGHSLVIFSTIFWTVNRKELEKADATLSRERRYGLPDSRERLEGKAIRGDGPGGGATTESIGEGLLDHGTGPGGSKRGSLGFGPSKSRETQITASLEPDETFFMGNLPREAILRVIDNHLPRIRYCYERALQIEPGLRGKIVSNFIIGSDGRVSRSVIRKSTLRNQDVEECVRQTIESLSFPTPSGGVVEVIFPFLFRVAG